MTLGSPSSTPLIPWWAHLSTMCNIIVILLGDGVLIYRCYFIWQYRRWVIIMPSMVLFASFVMAIVAFAANIGTNSLKPSYNTLFSTWIALSVASNTMSTGMIAGKLVWERRKLSKALQASHLVKYTTATAILIESALPLALAGIVSSIVFAQRANPTLIMVFPGIWICLSGLCPQLIIFRVAIGNSYKGDLEGNENVSHSIQFASSRPGVSQSTSSPHSTGLA
ncbi:hypothetical protein FA13DRAFT_1528374 [Coprinellus micaceus]|uniref:Uncharacterized protein n=1 Tax=Coprinellus micaceus TaxID=71717 RepID=A0A4Y7SJH2_COPMI|nr:hypothetical protein FA13DRAFT_1528374 [Coprinellus micaceus]